MTRWPPFSVPGYASGQSLRLQCGVPSRQIYGGAFTNSNRRNDVRHYRSVHSWPSRLRRTKQQSRLHNERVCIGYIGTDSGLVRLSNASLLKAGEDGRNQHPNVRRSSTVGVVEGNHNGRQKTRNHGYDVIVGGELYLLITPITLANLSR